MTAPPLFEVLDDRDRVVGRAEHDLPVLVDIVPCTVTKVRVTWTEQQGDARRHVDTYEVPARAFVRPGTFAIELPRDPMREEIRPDRGDLIAHMDACLIAITDGKPIPSSALAALPPWRAVLLARVAARAGVDLEHGTVDQLVAEAQRVGGTGKLVWPPTSRRPT